MKDCTCEGWKASMPQIESAQILANARGVEYTGLVFNFCPWCGEKREEESDSEIRQRIVMNIPKPPTISQLMTEYCPNVEYEFKRDHNDHSKILIKVKDNNSEEIEKVLKEKIGVGIELIVEEF